MNSCFCSLCVILPNVVILPQAQAKQSPPPPPPPPQMGCNYQCYHAPYRWDKVGVRLRAAADVTDIIDYLYRNNCLSFLKKSTQLS